MIVDTRIPENAKLKQGIRSYHRYNPTLGDWRAAKGSVSSQEANPDHGLLHGIQVPSADQLGKN
jgi:hypothetical protein